MFVVRAGWCPQLTNEHCEVYFFINTHVFSVTKLNPAYMGPMQRYKTLMFTYSLVIAVLSTKRLLTRQIYERRPRLTNLSLHTHFKGWYR